MGILAHQVGIEAVEAVSAPEEHLAVGRPEESAMVELALEPVGGIVVLERLGLGREPGDAPVGADRLPESSSRIPLMTALGSPSWVS
jgi:hypothetical protein